MSFQRFHFDGEVEETGGQQFVSGKGFAGDQFSQAFRPEPHGFASSPVRGGQGLVHTSRAKRDAAYILGGENPSLRPGGKFLTTGGTALYNANGDIISVVADKMRVIHSAAVHFIAPEIILEGVVRLGGPDASRPVSAQGTVDSGGYADSTNPATGVFST